MSIFWWTAILLSNIDSWSFYFRRECIKVASLRRILVGRKCPIRKVNVLLNEFLTGLRSAQNIQLWCVLRLNESHIREAKMLTVIQLVRISGANFREKTYFCPSWKHWLTMPRRFACSTTCVLKMLPRTTSWMTTCILIIFQQAFDDLNTRKRAFWNWW